MTVLITLTSAGIDTGPFDLYSDLDGFITPFESSIAKATLEGGYSSSLVPDYANIIRIKSEGDCTSYVDIIINETTTTTSSTSTTTTSTSSTTSTTTTTIPTSVYCYTGVYTEPDPVHPSGGNVHYYDKFGVEQIISGIWDVDQVIITASSIISTTGVGPCPTTTTTTTIP